MSRTQTLPLLNYTHVEIISCSVYQNKPNPTGRIIGWSVCENGLQYFVQLDLNYRCYCENGCYISVMAVHEDNVRKIHTY